MTGRHITGHTPGPWSPDPCLRNFVTGEGDDWVAYCGNSAREPETCAANARLIAAAPDMLAALRSVVELCYGADAEELGQEAARRAADAIAKAAGA